MSATEADPAPRGENALDLSAFSNGPAMEARAEQQRVTTLIDLIRAPGKFKQPGRDETAQQTYDRVLAEMRLPA